MVIIIIIIVVVSRIPLCWGIMVMVIVVVAVGKRKILRKFCRFRTKDRVKILSVLETVLNLITIIIIIIIIITKVLIIAPTPVTCSPPSPKLAPSLYPIRPPSPNPFDLRVQFPRATKQELTVLYTAR